MLVVPFYSFFLTRHINADLVNKPLVIIFLLEKFDYNDVLCLMYVFFNGMVLHWPSTGEKLNQVKTSELKKIKSKLRAK